MAILHMTGFESGGPSDLASDRGTVPLPGGKASSLPNHVEQNRPMSFTVNHPCGHASVHDVPPTKPGVWVFPPDNLELILNAPCPDCAARN